MLYGLWFFVGLLIGLLVGFLLILHLLANEPDDQWDFSDEKPCVDRDNCDH